jgi:amidohydrolase
MPSSVLPSLHDWLVAMRRHFHRFPELAYGEEKTAAKICEVLDELKVPHLRGVGGTGVIAALRGRKPGATLAVRADMDALPLDEANDVPYKSGNPGVMHACGHDGHMTVALGVLRWLIDNDWPEWGSGKVLFLFQPAEEGGRGGALTMLETGVFDPERIDAIFAVHVDPELPAGRIGLAPGTSNAASDSISIRIAGKGGHGAHPDLCVDPIVAGAYFITQLQSIVSRSVPPLDSAVLTIGSFHGGTARNIIPEEAVMEGTLRTMRAEIRDLVLRRVEEAARGLESSHGVSVHLNIVLGYPPVVNHPAMVEYTLGRARGLLGEESVLMVPPSMGAEDFAYFLQRWPGVLIHLGCHNPAEGFVHGLHSPHFDLDENALDVGVKLIADLLTHFGESG